MFGAHKSAKTTNQKKNLDALVKSLFQDDYLLLKRCRFPIKCYRSERNCVQIKKRRASVCHHKSYFRNFTALVSPLCTLARLFGGVRFSRALAIKIRLFLADWFIHVLSRFALSLFQEGLSRFGARFAFSDLVQKPFFPLPGLIICI